MKYSDTFGDVYTLAPFYRCETAARIQPNGVSIEIPSFLPQTFVPFSHEIFQTSDVQYITCENERKIWADDVQDAQEWLSKHVTKLEEHNYIRVVIWYEKKVFYKTPKNQIGKKSIIDLLTAHNLTKMIKVSFKRITFLAE